MVKFLEIQGPNCRETLRCPLPKAALVCVNKKKETPDGEGAPATEKTSLSHFHYGNTTELSAAGQFVTSLDSSGSGVLFCFIKAMPGNRYGPEVSSCQQTSNTHLWWLDPLPSP